jgi:hypothetical protein
MQIENSNNVQSEVKISDFSHSEIDNQPKSMHIQIHNEESKICILKMSNNLHTKKFSGTYPIIVISPFIMIFLMIVIHFLMSQQFLYTQMLF